MWHKGGLLHACSMTDFNIPVVGIHSLQVNTSKQCNKEKKHLQKMSSKPRGYTLSDTFFLSSFFSFQEARNSKILFKFTNQKAVLQEQVLIAGCEKLLQKVESRSTFCNKICTNCAFYRTKETCFTASDVTPVYGVFSALLGTLRNHDDDGNGNVKN